MADLTLESLAARVAALEMKLAGRPGDIPPSRDWRSVVGIMEESEASRRADAEMAAFREAERRAMSDEQAQ